MAADKPLAAVLVDEGYEDLEVHYPLLRLKEAGFHVEVAGDKSGHNFNSKHGYWAKSTKTFAEIDATKVKVLIVPGGWAPDRLRRWKDCLKLVATANSNGAIIGTFLLRFMTLVPFFTSKQPRFSPNFAHSPHLPWRMGPYQVRNSLDASSLDFALQLLANLSAVPRS